MSHVGKCCIISSRAFVHEKIYDVFRHKAAGIAADCTRDNLYKSSNMGPLVDEERMNKVLKIFGYTKQKGAHLLYGGKRALNASKQFAEFTVYANVTDDVLNAKEKILGSIQKIRGDQTTRLTAGVNSKDVNIVQKLVRDSYRCRMD